MSCDCDAWHTVAVGTSCVHVPVIKCKRNSTKLSADVIICSWNLADCIESVDSYLYLVVDFAVIPHFELADRKKPAAEPQPDSV